ncbi:DUF2569 family protein [Geotalea uraniireducens]|uniref:Zinc-ribbon domain-containing protein n=1 Tax=Geotalea uraniireducens (strain Rf4) TaxID=351605 RepID=A5G5I4_GEOUR|nr:DUF2569 family protein [Geotalea uraniireducens]ABQ27052.1 hypothetical protein Gura_2880 [Geotalea uraniireducens Rf4]
MYCTQCGAQAVSEAKFCAKCGEALGTSSVITEPELPLSLASMQNSSPATDDAKCGPTGVGGWLKLLVVGMLVLGPLMGAGRIENDFMMAEHQNPNITSLNEWKTFKNATWWTFYIVAAMSFYGGWGLARGRDVSVVNRAKAILWLTGPVASINLAIIIPFIIFGKTEAGNPQFIGGFFASVVGAIIWTVYLSKSKRVRNTYCNSKHFM